MTTANHPSTRRWYARVVAFIAVVMLSTFGIEASPPGPQIVSPGQPATITQTFPGVAGKIVRTIRVVRDGTSEFLESETKYLDDVGRVLSSTAYKFSVYTEPVVVTVGGEGGAGGPAIDADLIGESRVYQAPANGADTAAVAALAEAAGPTVMFSEDEENGCTAVEVGDENGCVMLWVTCHIDGECVFCIAWTQCPWGVHVLEYCCPGDDPDLHDSLDVDLSYVN